MFQVGQYVMYANEGVCRITAIGPLPQGQEGRIYYTMEKQFHSETIYTPIDTPQPIRNLMTRQEAEMLLSRIRQFRSPEAVPRDQKLAQADYRRALYSQDPEALLDLIRRIYRKNEGVHKPYSQLDERYFRIARELLHGELAAVFGTTPDEAEVMITLAARQE